MWQIARLYFYPYRHKYLNWVWHDNMWWVELLRYLYIDYIQLKFLDWIFLKKIGKRYVKSVVSKNRINSVYKLMKF